MSKIDELGGGLFSCFDDIEICAITCLVPCVTWGQIIEGTNQGEMIIHAALVACVPCWHPCVTAITTDKIETQLGGQPKGFVTQCCCYCCCGPCTFCQVARAVKKAKATGLIKPRGAPAVDEMEK